MWLLDCLRKRSRMRPQMNACKSSRARVCSRLASKVLVNLSDKLAKLNEFGTESRESI